MQKYPDKGLMIPRRCCAQDRGCLSFWSTWSHSCFVKVFVDSNLFSFCFRFIFQFVSNLSCFFGLCTYDLSNGYFTLYLWLNKHISIKQHLVRNLLLLSCGCTIQYLTVCIMKASVISPFTSHFTSQHIHRYFLFCCIVLLFFSLSSFTLFLVLFCS